MSLIERSRRPLDVSGWMVAADAHGEATAIDFEIEPQCHSNWCWAAVTASILSHYDPVSDVAQCEIANRDLDRDDCCDADCDAKHVPFNVPNVLASPLNRYGCFARMARMRRAEPEEVLAEMRAARPLCVRIVWRDGSGHFLAIMGYRVESDGDPILTVADPYWGYSEFSYSDLSGNYQLLGGAWTDTYFTRSPAAQAEEASHAA